MTKSKRDTMNASSAVGKWSTPAPLEIARSHAPTANYKGKLYVFGGGGPNFQSLNSTVCYNPNTDKWTELSPMPTLRSGAVAATLDDRIYVIGGGFRQEDGNFRFLRTVDIYFPETDTWESGPDMIEPHDYPAVAVLNDQIYVLGGHHPDATQGGPKTDPGFDFCERFDPSNNTWESIAPLPTPRFALSAVVMNGKIYAMGGVAFKPEGFNNFTIIETYDHETDSWSSDDSFALPWPAAGLGAAMAADKLYIFGGYSDDDIHNRTSCYNPATRSWITAAELPAPVAAMGVGTIGDTIYSIGGWADDGRTPINNVYAFDPNA